MAKLSYIVAITLKSPNQIGYNSKITVKDVETGKKETYGFRRTSTVDAVITPESPVGEALIGKIEGDIIKIIVPAGKRDLKVLKIEN